MSLSKSGAYSMLDQLWFDTGCTLLSDLHQELLKPTAARRIAEYHPEDFPLKEWNEVLHYLLGKEEEDALTEKEAQIRIVSRYLNNWNKHLRHDIANKLGITETVFF